MTWRVSSSRALAYVSQAGRSPQDLLASVEAAHTAPKTRDSALFPALGCTGELSPQKSCFEGSVSRVWQSREQVSGFGSSCSCGKWVCLSCWAQ